MPDEEHLRRMVERAGDGDTPTRELLWSLYRELRGIATQLMRHEREGHTLQPTALVHEAYVRLADRDAVEREAFLATAAVAMRHALVDHARARAADKRGGDRRRVTLTGLEGDAGEPEELDLLDVDGALAKLARLDPRQAQIVELRFFGGMTGDEIATHLEVSRATVVRELTLARAWLQRELTRGE